MIKITKTNWEKDELKHYFVIWSKSNPAQKTQESMESMQRLSVVLLTWSVCEFQINQ